MHCTETDPVVQLYAEQALAARLHHNTVPTEAAGAAVDRLAKREAELADRIIRTRARTLTGARLKVIDALDGVERDAPGQRRVAELLESLQQDLAEMETAGDLPRTLHP